LTHVCRPTACPIRPFVATGTLLAFVHFPVALSPVQVAAVSSALTLLGSAPSAPLPPSPPPQPQPPAPPPLSMQTCTTAFGAPCSAWWDGADAAQLTLSDANTVAAWADKSGSGYTLLQPSSVLQPAYVNGLGMAFTGAEYLYVSNYAPSFGAAYTVCAVLANVSIGTLLAKTLTNGASPPEGVWTQSNQKMFGFNDGSAIATAAGQRLLYDEYDVRALAAAACQPRPLALHRPFGPTPALHRR